MNTKCVHCGHNINKEVIKKFNKSTVGKVVCTKCNKENNRFIDTIDLYKFMLFQTLPFVILYFLITKVQIDLLVSIILFLLLYLLSNVINIYIYQKNTIISEEKANIILNKGSSISKKITNYYLVLLLILLFTINSVYNYLYILVFYLFLIFNIIKLSFAARISNH